MHPADQHCTVVFQCGLMLYWVLNTKNHPADQHCTVNCFLMWADIKFIGNWTPKIIQLIRTAQLIVFQCGWILIGYWTPNIIQLISTVQLIVFWCGLPWIGYWTPTCHAGLLSTANNVFQCGLTLIGYYINQQTSIMQSMAWALHHLPVRLGYQNKGVWIVNKPCWVCVLRLTQTAACAHNP